LLCVPKVRVDNLLAERGLATSRTAAAASVRAGQVRLGRDGPAVDKPGQLVADDAELLVAEPPRFVSRGGVKLENALDALDIEVEGRDCLDVGASTGGFTDCLLQRGAMRVAALDVGRGQLDWKLRNDERVTAIEGVNARELEPSALPFVAGLVTVDVSFISLTKLFPALAGALDPNGELLALVKPQFELGRDRVGKGGVVRDRPERRAAIASVAGAAADQGFRLRGIASSGLPGPKGNLETFIWAGREGAEVPLDEALQGVEV
jgi:23S rRNA (cytidine1920-2'-O)/16S rRNA (cytidine1409-2'-O)-methyltransferase